MKVSRAWLVFICLYCWLTLIGYAQWSEPEIVEGINFAGTDYYPSISSDGSKLYFASFRNNNEDIYVSERTNGIWSEPLNLGPPINSNRRELCPSISSDGQTLYFVTYEREGGYGSYDIWYSEWDDSCECWDEPVNAGPNINTLGQEWSPSISFNGDRLYFSSSWPYRPGHLGDMDLYSSEMGPYGWEPAVNLGINTYSDDYNPSIASDDTTLYFASWHHHNVPCWHGPAVDLFVAYESGGEWGNVTNLCDPINTEAWERSPSISSDGDTLYFASRRGGLELDDIFFSVKTETDILDDDSRYEHLPRIQISVYPNPFNSETMITYKNMDGGEISIYNVMGRKIKAIAVSTKEGRIVWDANDETGHRVSSGVYFIRARTSAGNISRKIVYLK